MSNDRFIANVFYRDPKDALAWLEKAFGFENTLLVEGPDADDRMIHAEMSFNGHGTINIGGEWTDWARSPASVGGVNTQDTALTLQAGIDEHCERARAAGARIAQEPADQPYGARTYRAIDLEGHEWAFAQETGTFSEQNMQEAGIKVTGTGTSEPEVSPTFESQLFYEDPKAAAEWLEKAFGFETSMLLESEVQGRFQNDVRVHMTYEDGLVALGSGWGDSAGLRTTRSSPRSAGANTQTMEAYVDRDIDAHCERARAAGGTIQQEPKDQFYGARTYRVADPEGHVWTFAMQLREVSFEEMERASGFTIKSTRQ